MEKFKQDCIDYSKCVCRHWWILVGVVLFAILGGGQDMFDYDFPDWIWWAAILVGLHVAQFLAWRDMRNERDALRKYDVTQETLRRIAEFRKEQIVMQSEPVNNDEEQGSWWQRYMDLRRNIISYISEHVSSAEALLFDNVGTFEIEAVAGQSENLGFEYVKKRSWIIRDHKWLDELAKDYGRERRRTEKEDDSGSR